MNKEDYFVKFDEQGIVAVKDKLRHGLYRPRKKAYAEEWLSMTGDPLPEPPPQVVHHTTNNIVIAAGSPKWFKRVLSWLPWVSKDVKLLEGDWDEKAGHTS